MDIGTAKITKSEMLGIPHHMIDVVEPNESFSVAEFKKRAKTIIDDVKNRGKLPIITGGTGLYINSLIYDYTFNEVSANDEIRDRYKAILNEKGAEYLHQLLKKTSPVDAERLHPNDTFRVIRALEVLSAGKSSTDNGKIAIPYLAFAIDYPREKLYERINMRVDKMFDAGLLKEVENLLSQGINFDCQSMKAIGYKEFKEFFEGTQTLEEVREKIKKNSRNYAKRQLTWFRKMENLTWCNDLTEAKAKIEELI